MRGRKINKKLDSSAKPNSWGMIQNVLLAGIRTGHTVFVILALIVIVFTIRLSSEDLLSFALGSMDRMNNAWSLGWLLFFPTLGYSWYTFKNMRRKHQQELTRISAEKTKWQERAYNRKLKSTK